MISGAFCRSARGWIGKCKTGSFYEAFWNKWCEGGSKPRSDCRSCTKTRYELGDSNKGHRCGRTGYSDVGQHAQLCSNCRTCLLYTSDAADDLLCVDLGGRRII